MTNTISIPDAREQLTKWANEWDRPELLELSKRMVRRRPSRQAAPARSKKVTPDMAESIRVIARNNPTMPLQDIASMFDVNAGRVSEALRGEL